MTPGVNGDTDDRPDHLAYLLNRANRRLRADAVPPETLPALSVAQGRLLDAIPANGCRIIDLSDELRVSKQGLGQLVAQLTDGGFLTTSADPTDRRAKRVRRTALGDSVVRAMRDLVDEVEDRWRREVGAERYAIFRQVLGELIERGPEGPERET